MTIRMNAEDIDIMTKEMRRHGVDIPSRSALDIYVYHLYTACKAIGRTDISDRLLELYEEMENVDTNDVYEIGTFR